MTLYMQLKYEFKKVIATNDIADTISRIENMVFYDTDSLSIPALLAYHQYKREVFFFRKQHLASV